MSSQLAPMLESLRERPLRVGLVGCRSSRAAEVADAIASLPLATVEVFGLSSAVRGSLPDAVRIANDTIHDADASATAVAAWQSNAVDVLLKLDVSTKILMRAMLAARAGGWFAHVALILDEGRQSRFLLSDSGLNRQPNPADIVCIVERLAMVAHALGTSDPTFALLSYREEPDPLFPLFAETLERHAKDLARLPVTLVGPISFDIAIDAKAAAAKGAAGVGVCDGIVSPDIVAANALYKAHMLRPDCIVAGIVVDELGHTVAVPSRAAVLDECLASVALAATVTQYQQARVEVT
jgi:phosphate butyryltransferase